MFIVTNVVQEIFIMTILFFIQVNIISIFNLIHLQVAIGLLLMFSTNILKWLQIRKSLMILLMVQRLILYRYLILWELILLISIETANGDGQNAYDVLINKTYMDSIFYKNVEIYLKYIMPKKEFKARYGK